MREVRYYSSFTDDFEESFSDDFKLPDDYKWVRTNIGAKFLSGLCYGLAVIIIGFYCKFVLHMKVVGRKNLRGMKGDFFIYGNHTQPVGDTIIPALCVLPRRIYTLVSTANYNIPVIGKLMPYIGGLPVTDSVHGMRELNTAIKTRLKRNHPIVIYPEAHVWEYYTKIRPFPDASFKYPVKFNKPAFAMTVTYQKGKIFKRPIMRVFIDGPFYAGEGSSREKAKNLHKSIMDIMKERSKNSNYEYIKYEKKP